MMGLGDVLRFISANDQAEQEAREALDRFLRSYTAEAMHQATLAEVREFLARVYSDAWAAGVVQGFEAGVSKAADAAGAVTFVRGES